LSALVALVVSVLAASPELQFTLQKRVETKPGSGEFRVTTTAEKWNPKQTAIIVCDMWDLHHCKNAVVREGEMAPRMNDLLEKVRAQGVFIIHAPSSCMKPYEGHPARERAKAAPKAANLPADIASWCRQIPAEEQGKYPIDQTDGGEDDDPVEHAAWAAELKAKGLNPRAPWTRQIDVLKIHDQDAISDSGVEVWNLLEQRGISKVILMGVHVNMCVAGRPFGLRQMAKNGKHVVLMRDLTDSMYNPARWPFVDHFRGTALFIEHLEKYVCPTITSDQIMGGKPFRFSGDKPRQGG
jgi:nicotinamidase-related amidase